MGEAAYGGRQTDRVEEFHLTNIKSGLQVVPSLSNNLVNKAVMIHTIESFAGIQEAVKQERSSDQGRFSPIKILDPNC